MYVSGNKGKYKANVVLIYSEKKLYVIKSNSTIYMYMWRAVKINANMKDSVTEESVLTQE